MPNDNLWTQPDLDSLIDDAVDDFRIASRSWGDAETGAKINAIADRLAEFFLASAQALSLPHSVELLRGVPHELPQSTTLPIYPQVFEALQIRLAGQFLGNTRDMAARCFSLLTLVFEGSPKEQVSRFLARVARCYILDLAPEAAVFCRGALENALNEKYDSTSTPWPRNEKGESPGPLRIQAAADNGWLSATDAREAKEVWMRGSKSAHQDPGVVTNTLETVAATARVLAALYRQAPGGVGA